MTTTLDEYETHDLFIASTRYYLGRMTIGVHYYARTLIKHWPTITDNARDIIIRDIQESLDEDKAGASVDVAKWEETLRVLALINADDKRKAILEREQKRRQLLAD